MGKLQIYKPNPIININVVNGKVNPLLNTASNIKNSLVHEYSHQQDPLHGKKARELRAIKAQKEHNSYKSTTDDYKKNLERYENKSEY